MVFLIVAIGGAIGAVLRYALSLITVNTDFPVITFIINLIGSFAIGFIAGMVSNSKLSSNWELFFKVGICGGFTTFSTFSLETFKLFESGKYITAGGYALASLVLCIVGAWLGYFISNKIFA